MPRDNFQIESGAQYSPKIRSVYYTGSTTPKVGMGVCYNLDQTGTGATDADGIRGIAVEDPSSSNNLAFAGVVLPGSAELTGPKYIQIAEPGSVCMIAVGGISTVVNTTRVTCSASATDAGRFTLAGLSGRGSAIALQTSNDAVDNAEGLRFASLDGAATTAWVDPSLTITATGVGTACGYGADPAVDATNMTVLVMGGADDTTGGDADTGEMAVVGEYAVVTAPTADTITIATDIGDVDATFYVIEGNPLVLAYLEDGVESGLQELISPKDGAAVAAMVGGMSLLCAGYTPTEASTFALADATRCGLRKGFACLGALGTEYKVTPASVGQAADGNALVSVTLNAAGETSILEWSGAVGVSATGSWSTIARVGAVEE